MSRKQVLLIVEGEKQEIKLFRVLFECYGLDIGYEIVSYNTNIYELYERMFSDGFQDDLSLLGVLKERASQVDKWISGYLTRIILMSCWSLTMSPKIIGSHLHG